MIPLLARHRLAGSLVGIVTLTVAVGGTFRRRFRPLTLAEKESIIMRELMMIFSPFDTPPGLGRGYFFRGGR